MALFFAQALLPGGWADNVRITLADDGRIAAVTAGAALEDGDDQHAIGIPGMPNVHAHAFQRGLAGLAEIAGEGEDSFWTWRQAMYRFLDQMTPDDVEAITAQAQVDMLEAGYTSVGEFHYLHHAPDGSPYADVSEMAGRIAAATRTSGIGLTLLPVLYAHGGFGGQPIQDQQRRFASSLEGFHALMAGSAHHIAGLPHARLGVAPHSLRAVTPAQLKAAIAIGDEFGGGPIHIHAAEQIKEVEDCLAWSGQRPVEWLTTEQALDSRWCLIHATHTTPREMRFFAETGAIAGLCPHTEANLGDGIFDAVRFLAGGGRFGIGSDSLIRVDVADELRALEYGQRLRDRARNVLTRADATRRPESGSTGRLLYDIALSGGAQALGRDTGRLAAGALADVVALNPHHPLLVARSGDRLLDAWIFSGDRSCISAVWSAGHQAVRDGRHKAREAVAARYAETVGRLIAGL